ncbi:hypothetical protein ACQPUR_03235 [Clostridium neonatale]|uniref:hypothetical protein n=1 Tax=Clostridium neonatale TaxID=137838 RepID=UPI003D338EBF
MNYNKIAKENEIMKQVQELEKERLYYEDLIMKGNNNEDVKQEYIFLNEQIDALMEMLI